MTARVGYVLSALLLGVGALVGLQFSSATFTEDSSTPAQVTAARDWTPPTVSVDDPGFVVNGLVTITATAADDDTSVASVEIQYRRQGTTPWISLCVDDDGTPWDCVDWDTETVVDGIYELRAIATDEDGNTETSDTITTEVYNTAGVVIDPVPSPVRGTIRLTASMVNVGSGASRITFQGTVSGTGNWSDLPGCTLLLGPDAFCDFNTTLGASGTTYDLRAVGRKGSSAPYTYYYDVQTGILVDNTAPTVTINKAAGQADPTATSPINFTVVFSEPVTGFGAGDVTLGGTSGGTKTAVVTGSGTTYNVAVAGMTTNGTVTASVPSAGATDEVGNGNTASTSTDNSVIYDGAPTNVTITQAALQTDPTNGNTINFTVVFDRSVTGFIGSDVTLTGTLGGSPTKTVTGSGTTYNVAVTNMTGSGTVIASIAAGVATDTNGNGNLASTSTDDTVTRDLVVPTMTVNQAASQADPTNASPINYTVEFSEPVTGFASNDLTFGGTSTGTKTAVVTGGPTVYNVAVSGMTGSNVTVTLSIVGASKVLDLAGNANTAGSTSTDNSVLRDTTVPTVLSVARAAGQNATTTTSPINFTITFSEAVTGFDTGDLSLAGSTAPGTLVGTVTGGPTTYNVAVSGMTSDGTVVASVPASVATDLAGNSNTVSGGGAAGHTVTYSNGLAPTVTINQAAGQADPTNGSSIAFTVVFSEPVTGLASGDFTLTSTVGGTRTLSTVAADGVTYTLTISGMTANSTGTVQVSLPVNKADDISGTANEASTSTDNIVTRDAAGPTVTINQAAAQPGSTSTSPINFTVVFGEAVTDFETGDVTITGSAGGTKTATVTGSGTTYNVAVSGMTTGGSVIANILAGRATDTLGNGNFASTSTDNSVTWVP